MSPACADSVAASSDDGDPAPQLTEAGTSTGTEEAHDDESSQSSEPCAIFDEAETMVNELIRLRREDRKASLADQHTPDEYMVYTQILTNMIAHDPALDMADYYTTLRYLGFHHRMWKRGMGAAQVFLRGGDNNPTDFSVSRGNFRRRSRF